MEASEVAELLGLEPHPEGGFYREVYRSAGRIPAAALPEVCAGDRCFSTAIYFLLTPDTFSAMHRIPTDEVFHFYAGDPVELFRIAPDGRADTTVLGCDLAAGQRPMCIVPGGVWEGSRLVTGGRWGLLGTTVAPGFEFADLEIGARTDLISRFPGHADRIRRLTRG
jgi:predicted cupin superfamily sugar epimerase